MAGIVHVPWYATVFRADKLEAALTEIAPIAARYGATSYFVHRNRDDRYKILQAAAFAEKADWERYWYGEEFAHWRAANQSYFQVPIIYSWNDISVEGHIGSGYADERSGTAPAGAVGDAI